MNVIIGIIIVFGSVIGGFALAGGNFLVLLQFAEFLIIGGATFGALLISTPPKVLKKMTQRVIETITGNKENFDKKAYIDLLKLLFEIFKFTRNNGMLALEEQIENPSKSDIFRKYPFILKKKPLIQFITDSLRIGILGSISPHDIDSIMEADLETKHDESSWVGMILQKTADSLPGLGIVAAVLGIVITMGSIGGPTSEVGHKVAAALVGTFLGVLLSYGFVQPVATNVEIINEEESRVYDVVKASIFAFFSDIYPLASVEFGRRSIFSGNRPTFSEMEKALKEISEERKG